MKANLAFSLISLFICYANGSTAIAAGKAHVEVSAKLQPDKRVELTFKTIPATDLVINKDGPWKLEITFPGKLSFDKKEYKRPDWKEDIAGFTALSGPSKVKSESIKYKMTSFVCTKDKTQCFREVIEGTSKLTW